MTHRDKSILSQDEIRVICENAFNCFLEKRNRKMVWWNEFIEVVQLTDIQDHLFNHFELAKIEFDGWDWDGEEECFSLDFDWKASNLIKERSKNNDKFQVSWTQNKNFLWNYSKEEQKRIISDSVAKGIFKLISYILSAILITNPLDSSQSTAKEEFLKILLSENYVPNSKFIIEAGEETKKFKNLIISYIEKYTKETKQTWKNTKFYDYDSYNVSFADEIINLIKNLNFKGPQELWLGQTDEKQQREIDFEMPFDPQNLLLLLNLDDYVNLQINKNRWEVLNKYFQGKIYNVPGMPKGYVRLLDKRALKMRICFTDFLHKEVNSDVDWYKVIYNTYVSIFQNFAGCLFIPRNVS